MTVDEGGFVAIWNFKFTGVRFLGTTLMPTNWTIKVDIEPEELIEEERFHATFSKLQWWVDNILNGSLFLGAGNGNAHAISPFISNNVVLTVDEPYDDHIAILLHQKLTNLARGTCNLWTLDIASDSSNGLSYCYSGDLSGTLPSIVDWMPTPYYFDQPWWNRADATTLDIAVPEDEDANIEPKWAFNLDFLDKSTNASTGEPGEVIRPQFRPTVIHGGKSDTKR